MFQSTDQDFYYETVCAALLILTQEAYCSWIVSKVQCFSITSNPKDLNEVLEGDRVVSFVIFSGFSLIVASEYPQL